MHAAGSDIAAMPYDNLKTALGAGASLAHITPPVVLVLFRFRQGNDGKPHPNNYIVTAYMRELG
jgi:hypothetical protein